MDAFRIVAATERATDPPTVPEPGPPDWVAGLLQQRVDQNVFGTHTRARPDLEVPVHETDTGDGSTWYIMGLVRSEGSDESVVAQDIVDGVVADAKWYAVDHHVCANDGDGDGGLCPGWTRLHDSGDVPGGI